MNEALLLLAAATQEYQTGNLDSAKAHAKQAVSALQKSESVSNADPSALLNALTLLQSIASRQHDLLTYETYETPVSEAMQKLLGEAALSCYAVHLLDACECYLNAGDTASAQQRLEHATALLKQENGDCPLFDFLHAHFNAKLHFHMEQYYECISDCLTANSLWMDEKLIPDDATAFLQQYASNETLITNLACSNLILISCAYGKINNPAEGIAILTELAKEPPEDYYLHTSMELILAELYTRAGRFSEARSICLSYQNQNPVQYPDLCASLQTLSIVLKQTDAASGEYNTNSLFTAEHDGALPASICYSRDAFQILLYNHGLSLIQKERFSEALPLFHQLGEKGLSLRLFLLAKTKNYTSIPACKKQADQYFDRTIRSLFLYYDEKLVFNHLSLLEYHFSLCMDAYVLCSEMLGRQSMPPEEIYDFLLNTKYFSMEASFLSRHYQSLECLNNRRPVTTSEIQNRLSEEELLLEYCLTRTVTESFYCVFLVTQNKTHCIRLCEKQRLDELLAAWQTLMLHTAHASARERLLLQHKLQDTDTRLRRLLYRPIKPFLEQADIRHLILAPVDGLLQFPFSCLSLSSGVYLGDRFEITYVNTAKELLTNAPLAYRHPVSTLIVGNPALHDFPPLPYAQREAEQAADYLNSVCYTGQEAVLSLLAPCFQKAPALVHIATHGVFCDAVHTTGTKHSAAPSAEETTGNSTGQAPAPDWNAAFATMEHSGLLFAGNELLSCNLISAMDFSDTVLTVLSACQTGQGIFHAAEGVYGLRRAFRLAGCHSMIVSLWQVDDRSGCLFMEAFYRLLTQTDADCRRAFRLAISELRSYTENGIRPYAHPYYWAGYLLFE